MARLIPLFTQAGVKAVFSGHEHNFQHSRADGIDYFVSGAAGKVRERTPNRFDEAHTQSWSARCHFLLVRIQSDSMLVRAIGEMAAPAGPLVDIERLDPEGQPVVGTMAINLE
jgi:hypothetical protein